MIEWGKKPKRRIKKQKAALGLCFALLLCFCSAWSVAQTARELTAQCTFTGVHSKSLSLMTDGNYTTYWESPGGDYAQLEIACEVPIAGIYLKFYESSASFAVQTLTADGAWETIAVCSGSYLTGYAQWQTPASRIRIVPSGDSNRLSIAQLAAFSEGDTPEWVQQWQPPLQKADLLVISAHPDDELLFLGGTLPTYAGERGLDVQVAYLVPSMPYRQLELLDGLWLCGVRHYPDFGPFRDSYQGTLREMYALRGWSEERVLRYVTTLYRKYRPEVVVTHDRNGEYGHGAHKVAADAALRCITLAADPNYQKTKLYEKESWQVKKLYLHLYEENALRMDWRQPLAAFEGRTAFDVAAQAFACHTSQQKTRYHVEDFGPYDNAKFGLAFSTVGEDVEKKDFFEHVSVEKIEK